MRNLLIGSMVSILLVGCGGVSSGSEDSLDTDTAETDTAETDTAETEKDNTPPPEPRPDSSCLIGSEGCQCTAGGGCDPGLLCDASMCVPDEDRGPDGAGGDPGTGGTGGTTGSLPMDIPWELTGILVNATHAGAGPGDKRLIVWTESTYDCSTPTGIPSCNPARDHSRLSIPISAEQLTVGSFTMANNGGISETGPNTDADDCWGGGGSLSGDVEIKSISADAMVVRLSSLDVIDADMRDLFQGQEINVVICN